MIGAADGDRLEQQRLMAEAAAAFARRELSPALLRGPVDRARWEGLASLGLTAVLAPEENGGLGLGLADMVPGIEELGRPLLREPLVASSVLTTLLLASLPEGELRAGLVSRIADGSLLAAVAWQENAAALSEQRGTRADEADGGVVLSGTKRLVVPGEFDGMIVSATGTEGTVLVWIEGETSGLSVERSPGADGGQIATVRLEAVHVDASRILAADGRQALARAIDGATIAAAAEMLGLIRGALDMTLDYLRTRKQFGRAIGSFQALQHRAADLYIHQELASVAVARGVADFETARTAEAASIAASRAKYRASSAALHVAKEAIQMHGGIGYTDEHDIGLYLKRALVLSAWLGNAAEHRAQFARLTVGAAR